MQRQLEWQLMTSNGQRQAKDKHEVAVSRKEWEAVGVCVRGKGQGQATVKLKVTQTELICRGRGEERESEGKGGWGEVYKESGQGQGRSKPKTYKDVPRQSQTATGRMVTGWRAGERQAKEMLKTASETAYSVENPQSKQHQRRG